METFIQQLAPAGFKMTPAKRLRLLKTLGGPGKKFLNNSSQLKYILCPVIAQNGVEQQRFYDFFDHFYENVLIKEEETALAAKPSLSFVRKYMPLWLIWSIGVLSVIGMLFYIFMYEPQVPERITGGIFSETNEMKIGETMVFKNNMPLKDTSKYTHRWEMLDALKDTIESIEKNAFHWEFEVPNPGDNPRKIIHLIYENKLTGKRDTFTSGLTIDCNKGFPEIVDVQIPKKGKKGDALQFGVDVLGRDSLFIAWDFGDGSAEVNAFQPTHIYEKNGSYSVTVRVKNEKVAGWCQNSREYQVNIGQENAYLTLETLQKDEAEPFATFDWGTWLLLTLLGIAALFYWLKWWQRKAPEVEKNTNKSLETPAHFKPSDDAPYSIPYRNQNAFISVDAQLFRFADTMRSRQEGLRTDVDIPASVQATIDGGGFPRLLEKRNSQPIEYLFLIDEQSMQSHQTQLFDYLVAFLKNKDILLETFYYSTDFDRFWNKYHPKGIDETMLLRQFPDHRLIVLGDGHGLFNTLEHEQQLLQKDKVKLFKNWKERLLISPLPPASWTWEETALYAMFPIFPADVKGLGQAMHFIENGQSEDEYRPDFKTWKAIFTADRKESDVNNGRWHRLKAYRNFLGKNTPEYKWLCALAVAPQPNWATTIAIGKALKDQGVNVTFDKLLLLSRIPFLQTGNLSGRLRLEMLKEIDENTETIARKAIRDELEAIKTQTENGHANFELQSQLAVQKFILDPEENKADIRFLLHKGLLDKRQIVEMEKAIEKNTQPKPKAVLKKARPKKATLPPPTLGDFLAETPPPPPKKPFFTPDFVKGIAASILLVILCVFILNWDKTDRLYALAFGSNTKTSKVVGNEAALKKYYYLVKEILPTDEAKILNNQSISIYENLLKREIEKQIETDTSQLKGILPSIVRGFNQALALQPEYTLAKTNLGKLWYNVGAELYNGYLIEDKLTIKNAQDLHTYYQNAIAFDSVRLEAWHGEGLLYFYESKRDSAVYYYEKIIVASDSLFFEGLQKPHLERLLRQGEIVVSPSPEEALSPKEKAQERYQSLIEKAARNAHSLLFELALEEYKAAAQLAQEFDFDGISAQLGIELCEKRLKRNAPPPQKYLWCLDNAHGKLTPGKRSPLLADGRQFFEYEFSRDITKRVMRSLDKLGIEYYNVVPEVEVDNFLKERVKRANDKVSDKPKIFLSIHSTASPTSNINSWGKDIVKGIETWYKNGSAKGKQLATIFQKNRVNKTKWKDRGIKTKPKQEFYTIREAKMLSILLETGFYNNKQEVQELMTNQKRQQIADAIVESILEVEQYGLDGAPVGKTPIYDTPLNEIWQNPALKKYTSTFKAPKMTFVKGGTFTMGCTPRQGEDCNDDEKPAHQVQLDDFYIGTYEVTQEEWEAVMGENPSEFKGCPKCPVESINWKDIQMFLKKLNERTGKKYRLPTEAEWEYAGKGGQEGLKYTYRYVGGDSLKVLGWYAGNSGDKTHPVGGKKANVLGIYDMSGNVYEWCQDKRQNDYINAPKDGTSWEEGTGLDHVIRGGSWRFSAVNARVVNRGSFNINNRSISLGLRLVRKP